MRPFDLHHHDTDENAGWDDVQVLMDRIQTGMEGRPHFELWESNDGHLIVEVGLAAMHDTEAWLLSRRKDGAIYFLAKGLGSQFYECIYLGCPEFIRDCCLLSRSDAEFGMKTLLERQKLHIDWHWVSAMEALHRLNR